MEKIKNKLPRVLPWVFFAILFLYNMIYMWRFSFHRLHTDTSAEMILGKLIADGNGFIPTNWIYSTEVRVFSFAHINAFFFHFTNDWILVRNLSALTCVVTMFAVVFWFFKVIDKVYLYPWVAMVLSIPFSDNYYEYVWFENIYTFFIVYMFLYILLYFLYVQKKGVIKYVCLFATCVVAFINGLSGMRFLLMVIAPLWVLVGIDTYSKKVSLKSTIIYFIPNTISLLIGLYINTKVFPEKFIIQDGFPVRIDNFSFIKLERYINNFFSSIGFLNNVAPEVKNLFSLMFFALLLVTSIYVCTKILRNTDKYDDKTIFIARYVAVSYLILLLFNQFTSIELVPRYFFPTNIMLIIAAFLIFEFKINIRTVAKIVLTISFAGFLFMDTVMNYKHLYFPGCGHDLMAVCEYLKTTDYEYGYGTIWNADVVVEYTNGQVDMYSLAAPDTSGQLLMWLQKSEHLDKVPDGKVVIIISGEEFDSELAQSMTQDPIYANPSYKVYGFDSYDDIPFIKQ